MIHSMSGGVLTTYSDILFAKVDVEGMPYWYIAPFRVEAGDKVAVPFSGGERVGIVLKTEVCTGQTAPVSVKHAREILRILPKDA